LSGVLANLRFDGVCKVKTGFQPVLEVYMREAQQTQDKRIEIRSEDNAA
jgi:hypothetical protein